MSLLTSALTILEKQLVTRTYLATERITLADIALALELQSAFFATVDAALPRTRELFLGNLSFHPEIVQEISTRKAPVLKCLELATSNSLLIHNEHVGHLFFKGMLPKLRILRISLTVFPWSNFPRGRLTQLGVIGEVSAVTSMDTQHDNLNQLICLLVDSASFEVLTLHNCLPTIYAQRIVSWTNNSLSTAFTFVP